MINARPLWILLLTQVVASGLARADDTTLFENKIRPVLVKHCYECHATDSKEIGGKLLLDSRQGILTGGESGPALIPGKPEESLIIQALQHNDLEMPPEKPLPEAVVNDFVTWVRQGAADPRDAKVAPKVATDIDEESLWSFFPRQVAPLPEVRSGDWVRDPIDRFVLARIEAAKLVPTHDADARTLVRRLYFDLIGLPPTPQQMEFWIDRLTAPQREARLEPSSNALPRPPSGGALARLNDEINEIALAQLVDELLASPHFGERWGRHWLDVARYGESNGDDGLGRNASFPHAWRYRDYVIDALNRDLPYDQFITEQIAGDLLSSESAQQRNRQLVATGFLAIGSKPAAAMNKNFAMDIVADQINAVSTGVLGLSVACARCHDHKHDPIPTRDYYAMAGIFASSETLYGAAAKEKLTAPPTALHELKSDWKPETSKKNSANDSPKFPESYTDAIDQLEPLLHARLDAAPEELTIESKVTFTPEDYAAVETATFHGKLPASEANYSVAFWFKNETKNNARPITAYLFSRAEKGNAELPGDHLGIWGKHENRHPGKLFVFGGKASEKVIAGSTDIQPGTWNHVVLIRTGQRVKVFLNGDPNPEIDAELPANFGDSDDYCFASRSDKFAPLVGNLAEFAIFARALTDDEAQQLHAASGQPRRTREAAVEQGLAMGVREKPKPTDCKIHINGDGGKKGPTVPRGFLTAYREVSPVSDGEQLSSQFAIDAKQSGRLQLAAWLTQADHPQTARVMANRIWLHLFGEGIVATPDDFGVYGARPSHPQLLDHLADRFVRDGWSTKRLIRAIVLSRTYRLDSRGDQKLATADPENRLFARHNRRRLDAESLRDSILQASGQLDLSPGQGSDVEKVDALINWPPGKSTNLHRPSNHRSVYLCMLRHAPPPEISAFDLPTGVEVVGKRNVTTLPTQTLYLLNSPLVAQQAAALGQLALSNSKDDAARVKFIFQQTLQRNPSEAELQRAIPYVEQSASFAPLAQALMTTNEFRYVD